MSFPRYPAYKDSGMEWLGEVPEHWEVKRIASLYREVVEQGSDELPVLSVSIHHGVSDSELSEEEMDRKVTRSEDRSKYKRVTPGDLVYNMMRAWQGAFGTVCVEGMVSPAYVVARPTSNVPSTWIEYLLRTDLAISEIKRFSRGITDFRLRLYWDEFKNLRVCLPPSNERGVLLRFLDRETAKIDALTAEQQRLIELLQEKRQAVISHAVTKGLNPDAPMKDSGVEWLGEVPVHWNVMPLRLAARIESGHTPSRSREDYWVAEECIYPWFTLGDVWQIRDGRAEYVFETQEKVSQIGLENSAARLLPANTVILSRTASVGFSGILGVPMATTQDFVNWICGPRIRPEYLLFVFRAMAKEFERLKYGSTHNTIYMPDIFSFRTPVPPLGEQRQIVSMVRESLRQFDDSFDNLLKSQELLQERRSALISAAVTGQIDVRGLAPEASAA